MPAKDENHSKTEDRSSDAVAYHNEGTAATV